MSKPINQTQQNHSTPPDHLIFRWYQDWVNANVTWEVGKKFDRYDQLRYVTNQAVAWGKQNKTMTDLTQQQQTLLKQYHRTYAAWVIANNYENDVELGTAYAAARDACMAAGVDPFHYPQSTMTNLTETTQAVMTAYNNEAYKSDRHAVAAALRAATNQLGYLLPFEDSSRIDVADLLAIADELEGITYGTYRCDLETQ